MLIWNNVRSDICPHACFICIFIKKPAQVWIESYFEEGSTVFQSERITHLKPASGENICGLFFPFLQDVVMLEPWLYDLESYWFGAERDELLGTVWFDFSHSLEWLSWWQMDRLSEALLLVGGEAETAEKAPCSPSLLLFWVIRICVSMSFSMTPKQSPREEQIFNSIKLILQSFIKIWFYYL